MNQQDETVEQEEPESKRQRVAASLPVCSRLIRVDEIPVSYVATHEMDDRPVYDHKTGERLSLHLVYRVYLLLQKIGYGNAITTA